MFKELRYRKEVEFRWNCYLAGIVAADNRNARRGKDGRIISALDYAIGEDQIDAEREQTKANIRAAWGMANGLKSMTKEESATWRQRRVNSLINEGWSSEDSVAIVEETFEE